MTIAIGVTGARQGATRAQLRTLTNTLLDYYQTEIVYFHHGACQGVDEQAALIARSLKFRVIAHPPESYKYLSMVALGVSHMQLPKLPYLERDRVVVDKSNLLIALPAMSTPQPRSGTWYTYNYAKEQNKTAILILPDGTTK